MVISNLKNKHRMLIRQQQGPMHRWKLQTKGGLTILPPFTKEVSIATMLDPPQGRQSLRAMEMQTTKVNFQSRPLCCGEKSFRIATRNCSMRTTVQDG